ncbi:MAG: pyridoxal-phosphate dependent enzyme [bacterium]|nr:pyridoxal-phosphate dependent enzyme [bacterium]
MWHLSSRIHKLNYFPETHTSCFVKRDDELSCGISGTKMRKYISLMPFLIKEGVEHLIIIAGPQSNNLLAALQMAREFKLSVTVFLLKPKSPIRQGNFKLSSLFLKDEEIIWIERNDWHQVESLAQTFLSSLKHSAFILSEGASVAAAFEGAMTLADDIIVNEQQLGFTFDHIFIDAGTGFSAIALINRLAFLEHTTMVHVLLLADKEEVFHNKLQFWTGLSAANYCCFYPKTAKSFGSVNQTVKQEIRRMAREEGILADPIYSAKLFHETRRMIQTDSIYGNVLIIHSGGILTMPGFDY